MYGYSKMKKKKKTANVFSFIDIHCMAE